MAESATAPVGFTLEISRGSQAPCPEASPVEAIHIFQQRDKGVPRSRRTQEEKASPVSKRGWTQIKPQRRAASTSGLT